MSVSIFRPPPSTERGPAVPLVESHIVLTNPSALPAVWNGVHRYMMPSLFAVWSDTRKDYQIVQVDRESWPLLTFTCIETQRSTPFFFVSDSEFDRQSRTVTVYRPRARIHTHVDVAVWYTGGWLCKRNGMQLCPVIPFLGLSDHRVIRFCANPGLYVSQDYLDWQLFQTPFHTTHIIRDRILFSPLHPSADRTGLKDEDPAPIPIFAATALLRDAVTSEQSCAITMEPVTPGQSSVTSCFHIFDREALRKWFTRTRTCPVCKQACSTTDV